MDRTTGHYRFKLASPCRNDQTIRIFLATPDSDVPYPPTSRFSSPQAENGSVQIHLFPKVLRDYVRPIFP